jgi:flagellar basal body P-ring formation protein FlgA
MAPIFRHIIVATSLCAAPAAAQDFQDLDMLDSLISAALGAGVGEQGGPTRPLDRRLRLAKCPDAVTIDEPALGAVAVRCPSLGWRIRVPLVSAPAQARAAAAPPARAETIIRRGDQVEVVALASSFSVSTSGVAEQDGAPGDRIRVRTERRSPPLIGEVMPDGRVALAGFN